MDDSHPTFTPADPTDPDDIAGYVDYPATITRPWGKVIPVIDRVTMRSGATCPVIYS